MRNHLLSYDVLTLEGIFHDVWVECNRTLYWSLIDYLWAVMPCFGKGGGSCNSYDMRLFGMSGIGLLISPCLRTYTSNIWILRDSIPMYTSMFWVTLAGDSTSFPCGVLWHWISWCSHDLCRLKLMFPMNECGQPQMMHIMKLKMPKVLGYDNQYVK